MSSPDEEKLGVKLHTRPFRDTISTVPIKKRRLFFHRSPSPPPETEFPPTIDYKSGNLPTKLTDKGSSDQSGFTILANGDINEAPVHHDLIRDEYNDREHIDNGSKDTFSCENFVSCKGIARTSKSDDRADLAMEEENLDSKNISNETSGGEKPSGNTGLQYKEAFEKLHIGNSVRIEPLDLQDPCLGNREKLDMHDLKKMNVLSDSKITPQSFLHRSNWDLNVTMDTWEESSSDSAMKNHECEGNGRPGFNSLLDRNIMSVGSTREESNASPLKLSEPKSLSNDTFLSLHSSPEPGPGVYNTETEAYLDLRLKPSFIPEPNFSCKNIFNLGKVDSLEFLSLSMNPSSTPETIKIVCRAVKPERHGSIQKRKTESFLLNPIKPESCEIGGPSRIKVSGFVNPFSVASIKPEPVEDQEQSQEPFMAKETRVSHLGSYDHNLIKSAQVVDSNTKADSHMKDVLLQMPRECPKPLKYEVNSMVQVMQDTDKGTEFIPIKHASNDGSEHADFFSKSRLEEGQHMNLLTESWEDDKTANLQEEPSTSGTLVENIADEKSEVVSRLSLSETDSKTEHGAETYLNSDVIEFSQTDKGLSIPMEECDNESDPGSSHAIDGGIGAVFEKGGVDGHGFEDGELRDEASLRANAGSHLIDEIEKSEDLCSRGLVNVSVALSSSYERGEHLTVESPEMSKDPGTVECVNNGDPSIIADPQESSSVTGDSSRRETSREIRKIPRDSSRKDKISERKAKFDRDPTIVNIDKKGDGSGVVENSGGHIESSFPLPSEAKRDSFGGGRSGRIINLNSSSSRNLNRIHESPLSSRIEREKSLEKSYKKQKYRFGRSRDEDLSKRYHKTENEKQRSFTYGKRGSGSVHARVRGGSNSSHSRVRDERQPNPYCDKNFDMNYLHDRIHDHDDFRYSRPIPSAEVAMNSTSDASISRRIPRKISNEFHHPTSEVNSDLGYVPQEKNRRTMPNEMLDRAQPHGQFDRTDRIPAHQERLSLSPRSRGMSPSHWPPYTTPEGFNGQADMVQCRSGASIVMQESMRSTRQQCLTEEMFKRRQGSGYRSRLQEDMMEAGSSREHEFLRRDFSRKIQPRQVADEYYSQSVTCGQVCELPADNISAGRRRYSEVRDPVRYRQRCIDDDEDFSFHVEEGSPRSYRYHAEGDQRFNGGGSSSEGRIKNRLGNTSRRYRHIEEHRLHEDGFRHQAEQGWNDSGLNNVRPRNRRY